MVSAIGLGLAVHSPVPLTAAVIQETPSSPVPAMEQMRVTGADMDTAKRFGVAGTDLGIPYLGADGSIKFEFGDTFTIPDPAKQVGLQGWRSPVILRSLTEPVPGQPIVFDSAVGLNGYGIAPEVISNGHNSGGEFSVIPTDGISFSETGDEIISYMSIRSWNDIGTENWQTNGAGLAWSPDGEHFHRIGPVWENTPDNKDPFQMWTMARRGDYVYVISVRAGRQYGPMMLRRVHWNSMLEKNSYECFNGRGWGGDCQPLQWGRFGEPSLRWVSDPDNLMDGKWVLSYLEVPMDSSMASSQEKPRIVTRTSYTPAGTWSTPKIQVTWDEFPYLYGGFIHPRSTPSNLIMMVSTWRSETDVESARYDVTPFYGSI